MDQKYQILHNAIFNTSSWIFSIVLSFAFLPYIVHKLGVETYGILVLILTIIGYFALLDLNLGQAVIKYVAEHYAENDLKKINDIVGVTILLYLILGVVGGLGIFFLSHTITERFLKIREELLPAAHFALCIGSLGFLFTMLLSALSAIPKGLNRYDITSKVTILMSSVTTLMTVFILYIGFGLREIVILNISVSLLGILCYCAISKWLLPGFKLTPTFNCSATKKVLKFGLFSSLSRLSGLIQFQADRLLTGAILGMSWVTYYVVPFSVVSKAMSVTFHLGSVILPVVSGLQGKRDFTSVIALYLKSSRLIIAIATAVCLPMILFGDQLLGLWMDAEFKQNAGMVILLLTISLYVDAFTNVPSIVVDGLGRPKITGLFAIANAVVNLVLIYPLGKAMGINGIALAFLISHVSVAPVFVFYVNNRVLRFSMLKLFKEAYVLPFLSGLLTALPLLFLLGHMFKSLFALLGIMMATTILYLLISSIIGVFSRNEIKHCLDYLYLISRRVVPSSRGSIATDTNPKKMERHEQKGRN